MPGNNAVKIFKDAFRPLQRAYNIAQLLLVGGVVLLIGVIYMLVQTRSSHEGFEAPLEWDHDKEVMVVFHKMKHPNNLGE